jgi:hypothetical protein
MKPGSNLRLFVAMLTLVTLLLITGNKRIEHSRHSGKGRARILRDDRRVDGSNTDYIFFESVSKYLFMSLD